MQDLTDDELRDWLNGLVVESHNRMSSIEESIATQRDLIAQFDAEREVEAMQIKLLEGCRRQIETVRREIDKRTQERTDLLATYVNDDSE